MLEDPRGTKSNRQSKRILQGGIKLKVLFVYRVLSLLQSGSVLSNTKCSINNTEREVHSKYCRKYIKSLYDDSLSFKWQNMIGALGGALSLYLGDFNIEKFKCLKLAFSRNCYSSTFRSFRAFYGHY